MKFLFITMALLVSFSFAALGAAPKCVRIDTRWEGWQLPGQDKTVYEKCDGRIAYCGKIGTRSEGWYSGKIKDRKRIIWAKCSKDITNPPECVYQGTSNEAWKTPSGNLFPAVCAEKVPVCSNRGSKSEGWYAATMASTKLLLQNRCSQD